MWKWKALRSSFGRSSAVHQSARSLATADHTSDSRAQNLDQRLSNVITFATMGVASAIQPISIGGRMFLLWIVVASLLTGAVTICRIENRNHVDLRAVISITTVPFVVGWCGTHAVEAPER